MAIKPSVTQFKAQAQMFKALAHPGRLLMLDELSRGERCVCELAALVGSEMPTVSRHLSQLKNAGISSFVIDARGRTPRYTGDMTAIYRESITLVHNPDGDTPRRLAGLKEQARRCAWGGITTGPFLHGLKEE